MPKGFAATMDRSQQQLTLAHVTHEAIEQVGGIGTVLQGLATSPPYRARIGRSILIGPAMPKTSTPADARLGEHGRVLYSSADAIDESGLTPLLERLGTDSRYRHDRTGSEGKPFLSVERRIQNDPARLMHTNPPRFQVTLRRHIEGRAKIPL